MKKLEFLEGLKDGIPICLGYFSVSIAFGMTAVLNGVPLWAAVLISLTNLTSAGQFAGTNILIAHGTMPELALTTLIINIRYFLMSLSVSQNVSSKMKLWQRFAVSFGITDEVFAVSMQRKQDLSAIYMTGLILTPLIGWVCGTLTGAAATALMPKVLSDALGIALYAMFIAIIIPPAKNEKRVLFTVVLSILASVAFTYAPLLKSLSGGWAIIIITIAVSALAATLFPIDVKEEKN